MPKVTATCTFAGHELKGINVVNPGSCGKTWLFEIEGCLSPLFLILEGKNVCHAIDELAESKDFGHTIVVEYPEGDHDPDDAYHGPSGQLCDLKDLRIHGQEWAKCPFPCKYHGKGLPKEGISPAAYWRLHRDG